MKFLPVKAYWAKPVTQQLVMCEHKKSARMEESSGKCHRWFATVPLHPGHIHLWGYNNSKLHQYITDLAGFLVFFPTKDSLPQPGSLAPEQLAQPRVQIPKWDFCRNTFPVLLFVCFWFFLLEHEGRREQGIGMLQVGQRLAATRLLAYYRKTTKNN